MEFDFAENIKSEKWDIAAKEICRKHHITYDGFARPDQSEHVVFLIDDSLILKIYCPERNCFERERASLEEVKISSIETPEILASGEFEGFDYLFTTQIRGSMMARPDWLKLEKGPQISLLGQLADGLKELHTIKKGPRVWESFIHTQLGKYLERQVKAGVNERVIKALPGFIDDNLPLLLNEFEPVFLHGDIHFGNLRFIESGGKLKISGLFDFADSLSGFNEFDFVAIGLLMIQGQGALQREFFRAYGYSDSQINDEFRRRQMLMTILYECSDLRRYALRLSPEAVDYGLEELMMAIWNF